MTLPKISKLYYLLNHIKGKLKSSKLIEELKSVDQEFLDDINAFNDLVLQLQDVMNSNDANEIVDILIKLRIQSMNIESIFSNLTDELSQIIVDL